MMIEVPSQASTGIVQVDKVPSQAEEGSLMSIKSIPVSHYVGLPSQASTGTFQVDKVPSKADMGPLYPEGGPSSYIRIAL